MISVRILGMPATMRRLLHAIAHRLGWNVGVTDRHHLTWMGFRCSGCGKVQHKDLASWHRAPKDEDFA